MNAYTPNGTIFYKRGDSSWAVQVAFVSGAGRPFKVIKWATWKNPHMFLSYQETNEGIEMYGWEIVDNAGLLLYCPTDVIPKVKDIQALVRLGYKGQHSTSPETMAELEWRFCEN